MKKARLVLLSVLLFLIFSPLGDAKDKLSIEKIKLPKGFKINVYADNVPNARAMTLGAEGTLFVGTRSEGKVYALKDDNHDGVADRIKMIASELNMPSGIKFFNGDLYVGEVNRILRFENIESNLENPKDPIVVNDHFPTDTHHGWKFIAFGPDEKLYVPVGAPCNVCEPPSKWHSRIWRMNPDGSELEVFAEGIRNTVGFDWHPETGELWFTENGRDWLGDDLPPDELNVASQQGMHFGFPYCHGKEVSDPEFGYDTACEEFTPPALELGAHVAALGMRFYAGEMFPSQYDNSIMMAEHGSWNSSTPVGYRIMNVTLEKNKVIGYEVFAEGWLSEGKVWGRPADVLVMPDGSLLVSDDHAGAIYRITYDAI